MSHTPGHADPSSDATTAGASDDAGADARDAPQRVAESHGGHGHSMASWTAVGVVLLGTAIGCVGVLFLNWWVLGAGIVVALGGGVLGKTLHAMGFGEKPYDQAATETRSDTR